MGNFYNIYIRITYLKTAMLEMDMKPKKLTNKG